MSKLVETLLQKKPDLLSKYVSVSTVLVSCLVAPLSMFMEHLLVIQGIDPSTKPTDLSTKIVRDHFDVTFPVFKFAKPIRYDFGGPFFPTKGEDKDTGTGVTIHIPRDSAIPVPKIYAYLKPLEVAKAHEYDEMDKEYVSKDVKVKDSYSTNEIANFLKIADLAKENKKAVSLSETIKALKEDAKQSDDRQEFIPGHSSESLKDAIKALVKYASALEEKGKYQTESKAADSFKRGLFRRVFETKK